MGRILRVMEDKEREWKLQRTRILEEGSGSANDANVLAILILLVLGSPLWLLGLCIRTICLRGMLSRVCGRR